MGEQVACDRPAQHFANFYLHPLDHFIRDQLHVRAFIRYVDDVLMFHDDKARLHHIRDEVARFLCSLRLKIHENRAQPTPATRPLPFLGYVVTREAIRVRSESLPRARRRHRRRITELRRGERTPAEFKSSVFGWLGYATLGGWTGAVTSAVGVELGGSRTPADHPATRPAMHSEAPRNTGRYAEPN